MLLAPPELDAGMPIVGLTIDAWIDVVPTREKRGGEADAPIDERRVSGIAINAAAASARPPQAMLLAISPDGQRWTTDALVDTLAETLELAKIRAVTLEITPGYASVLPAAYQASYSLQGEKVLDIGALAAAKVTDNILAYIEGDPVMSTPLDIAVPRKVTAAMVSAFTRVPAFTRLEPQSISGDPTPGLEARVHDALWMLSRQWQLGEFEGRRQRVAATGASQERDVARDGVADWRSRRETPRAIRSGGSALGLFRGTGGDDVRCSRTPAAR